MIVTGSHLRRLDREGPAPVDVFDALDLQRSGVNTLPDFVRYLTYNVGVPNEESTAGTGAAGTSFFNLRGVGAQATLILINGRRIAPYGAPQASGHAFVDLNSIPVTAIESIEVLEDGASAIYGADAVAGVVNIILKRDYDGLSLGGGYLSTTRADATETTFDVTWGRKWQRTSLISTASYLHREAMSSTDRTFLADADLRSAGGFNLRLPFSSPMSAFRHDTGRVQADPACPPETDDAVAFLQIVPQPHLLFDSLCTFNQKIFTDSTPETDRLGLTAAARQQLSDFTELFADVIVNRNETRTRLPPAITDKTPLDAFFPLVEGDHPDNPFGSVLETNYMIVDAGPMSKDSEALSWRLASGLDSTTGAWDWSASALWSVSEVDATQFNLVDSVGFQDALLGMGGPNRDQYYNPFGISPENSREIIAAFVVPVSRRFEQNRERAIDLGLSRRVFTLTGGPAALALGYQYRNQRGWTSGDEFQTSGTALGVELLRPLEATRDINSAYFELALPVLPSLELQLAARYEHYSDLGTTTNPKLAARWEATDSVVLRGSVGTSFRAPTFTELFEQPQTTLMFLVDSPRCALTGAPLDCFPSPYQVVTGGDERLQAETGRSWFFGLEWSPQRVPGLELDVDLWRFDHDDRIVELGAQFIIDELGANSALVVRGPPLPGDPPGTPGRIELVDAIRVNVDQLSTRGVDFDVRYALPTARWGDLDFDMRLTYLDDYSFRESTNEAFVDRNLAGGADLFPLPRVRGNLTATWSKSPHGLAAMLHYVGSYRSPLNLVIDGIETDTRVDIDDHLTLDLQYEYEFARLRYGVLRVGCQNCGDARPPVYNYTANGEQLHDPRGAILYVRWSQPI